MQKITLYRVVNTDGSVTVTPKEPEQYDSTLYRLIADEGMELVKGEERTIAVDVDIVDGWEEVEINEKIEQAEEAYNFGRNHND